ncbi:MAG: HAS-barrel domain-containing protein, partial [Candidatus Bathyarchaeia archaeon]
MSDSHEQLERLGYVIGEASPSQFYFIADEDKHPPRWEYVVVKSREVVDGFEFEVPIIAQIYEITSLSLALDL